MLQTLPPHAPRWLRCLAFVLAAWLAFAFSFTPLRSSHDEFWHLKTGQYIAQHGLPQNEIFTYTAANFPWHNHEWLTQLAMYRVYELGEKTGVGGIRAVIGLKTLFILLAFAAFGWVVARDLQRRGLDPFWAALASAVCVALARRTFYPRPPFVTYFLIALVLWVFIETGSGRWRSCWLWLLPPLFALWANLHGAWMAGLIIVGAFWADAALKWLTMLMLKTDAAGARSRLLCMTLIAAACAVATLLNPYGYHLYELVSHVFGDTYLLQSIGEMQPPDLNFVWVLPGIVLLFAAAALRPGVLDAVALCAVGVLLRLLPQQYAIGIAVAWLPFSLVLHGFRRWPMAAKYAALALLLLVFSHLPPEFQLLLALPFAAAAIARAGGPAIAAHILVVCFFMQQGIMHVRHLSLLGVVALPGLAWALAAWAESLAPYAATQYGTADENGNVHFENGSGAPQREWRPAAWLAAAAALLALSVWWLFNGREGVSYWDRNVQLANGQALTIDTVLWRAERLPLPSSFPDGVYLSQNYPVAAVDFLLQAGLPAPLFNGGNYAGYLIWRLAPEHMKVFTDNRYDIYGGVAIREEHSVLNGWTHRELGEMRRRAPGFGAFDLAWNEVLDKWNVQTVFIPVDAAGNVPLAQTGWQRVYQDLTFNLWVRNTPANATVIARARGLEHPVPYRIALLHPKMPAAE